MKMFLLVWVGCDLQIWCMVIILFYVVWMMVGVVLVVFVVVFSGCIVFVMSYDVLDCEVEFVDMVLDLVVVEDFGDVVDLFLV